MQSNYETELVFTPEAREMLDELSKDPSNLPHPR